MFQKMGKRKAKEKPGDIEEKGDAEEVEAVLTTPRAERKAKKQKTPGPGRPSKLSTPVKTMSPGRRGKYDRERQAACRDQDSTPKKQVPSNQPGRSGIVGRPPLFGTAMSPNSLNQRSNFAKKKIKTSLVRSRISTQFWQSKKQSRRNQEEEEEDECIGFDEEGNLIDEENDDAGNSDEANQTDENENSESSKEPNQSTLWRNKVTVKGFLSSFGTQVQAEILARLVYIWHKFNSFPAEGVTFKVTITSAERFLKFSKPCDRTIHRHAQKLLDLLSTFKYPTHVINSFFTDLLSDPKVKILFKLAGLEFHDCLKPRLMFIKEKFAKLSQQMSSKFGTAQERILRAKLAIQLVEECGLSLDTYGDISNLAVALSCSASYAKKVLTMIGNGTPEKLFKREVYNNAIKATDWPEKLREFVILPDNSRPVPGKDTISIRRGCRVPKYVLKRNKLELIQKFLEDNPSCPFSSRTLLREFPQFAVTPTAKDKGRNTCAAHSNGRRLLVALQKQGILTQLPVSCRSVASLGLCKPVNFSSGNFLSWLKECCVDPHKNCPKHVTVVPEEKINEQVSVLLWATREDPNKGRDKDGKVKKVHGLFPHIQTVPELAKTFDKNIVSLKNHIYTASWEFHVLKQRTETLCFDDLITIEDYQQNLSIYYREMTTSMGYSANITQIMIYPIALRYVEKLVSDEGVETTKQCKGFVVFLSKDLKHDHQQVLQMERRMFEVLEEKLGRRFKNWLRKSDGCSSQFKCRYSTAQLQNVNELVGKDSGKVEFQYFETDEGKSESDMAGALVKAYYEKGVLRPVVEEHEAPRTVEDVVDIINANQPENHTKIDFFHVESFAPINRALHPPEVVLKGIRKLHSITRRPDGSLLGLKLSCYDCTVGSVCDICAKMDATVTPDTLEPDDLDPEMEVALLAEDNIVTLPAEDQSDAEDEEEELEDDEGYGPGSIVWIKIGRLWFPGKVIPNTEVAEDVTEGNLFVKRYEPFNDIRRIPVKNVDTLGENRVDAQRSSKSDDINLAYGLALSEQLGDLI